MAELGLSLGFFEPVRKSRGMLILGPMRARRANLLSLGLSTCALGCGNAPAEGQADGTGGRLHAEGGAPGSDLDASPGCGLSMSAYSAGTTEGSVIVSTERSFRVHVPPGYVHGRPTPLVLMFHGGGGSADQFQNRSARMDAVADREGFITVYPEGTGVLATWNGGICCGRAAQDDIDDVAFVDALLDHLESALCVDRTRVFASGMSNGAILSHRLACELSERISAIAPVAGTIGVANCAPTRDVPVMQIHGSEDGHVPWEGGVGCGPTATSFVSVPESMEGWRTRNGCDATSRATFTQGNGSCAAYEGCSAAVELCTINGAGHSWPGGEASANVTECPDDGPQSESFSASEAVWRFFSQNPRL